MSNINTVLRRAERVHKLCEEATDPLLLAASPPVAEAAADFKKADDATTLVTNEVAKSRVTRGSMTLKFGRELNQARECVFLHEPQADLPRRASALSTPDDVLNAGRKMDLLLSTFAGVDDAHPLDGTGDAAPTGEAWAIDLAREFRARLTVAIGEYDRAVAESERLQKARDVRAEKRELLEDRLIHFRRLVRDTYGPHSLQYRRIKDRLDRTEEEEQVLGETPVTAPPSEADAA